MAKLEMMEVSGLPTYYVTHVVTENAGGGNVRIWDCTERNGILMPVCEIIIPSSRAMFCARRVTDCAMEVFNSEMMLNAGAALH